jgi:hypothetical protein
MNQQIKKITVFLALFAAALVFFGILLLLLQNRSMNPIPPPSEGLLSSVDPIEEWISLDSRALTYQSLLVSTNLPLRNPTDADIQAVESYRRLHKLGPSLVPELIEKMRSEMEPDRLARLATLLGHFGRISLTSRTSSRDWKALTQAFLAEWDQGMYAFPETELEKFAHLLEGDLVKDMAPFEPINRYGIFALPWLISLIHEINSPRAMRLFCGKVDTSWLHEYDAIHQHALLSRDQKVFAIKKWWADEHHKYNQLHPLYDKIDAAVKALPEYPEERAPEN